MDVATYLRAKARMTQRCLINCSECPLGMGRSKTGKTCAQFEDEDAEKAIEIVEQWSKEHPRKTYLSDLLEKYPEAATEDKGYPTNICPHDLWYTEDVRCCGNYEECWNTPMED